MGRKFDEMKLHLGIFILTMLYFLYRFYSNNELMIKYKNESKIIVFIGASTGALIIFAIFELILFALDCIFNFNLY